jgi:hypothetical protein
MKKTNKSWRDESVDIIPNGVLLAPTIKIAERASDMFWRGERRIERNSTCQENHRSFKLFVE